MIAKVSWFLKAAVVADAKLGFEALARYTWKGELFKCTSKVASSSHFWADLIVVDEEDLRYLG